MSNDNVIDLMAIKTKAANETLVEFREAVSTITNGRDFYPANDNEDPENPFGGIESYFIFAGDLSLALTNYEDTNDEDLIFMDEDGNEFQFCPDEDT